MANITALVPKILYWEGGFVDDPKDRGGATNMGVTIATWKAVGYDKDGDHDIDRDDIKLLDRKDYERVLHLYWDRWQADRIQNQSVANILVDWVWGSGKWGIVIPQRILGVLPDGKVGNKTINAVNAHPAKQLFESIYNARVAFLNDIIRHDPTQRRFIKGWMNRMESFTYSS